jgi:zinc/manganese transport system substrate-binding protein
MTVVATFSVAGDMLTNIAGNHIVIKSIVGADNDCELYQPTVGDVATMASARAVFLNDLNEEFEPPLLKQAAFKGAKVVVTWGVRTLTAEEEHPVSGRQLPSAIDQHAWLDPRNGTVYVRNITEALVRLDPANAADYRVNAAAYTKEIQAIDEWGRKEITAVPLAKRRLLTSLDSLQYLANAYGVTLLTVNGWTNKSEPSAVELAKLAQRIRANRGVTVTLAILGSIWRSMRGPAFGASEIIVALRLPHLSLLFVKAYPTSFLISPTEFAATAIVHGAKLFAANCTTCHGDGPVAKSLPVPSRFNR